MREELPPGPRYPAAVQGIGFWTRPLAFLERCRARYGKRFRIPFGGGRRRCLGASFATLETKLVLRTLLGACELKAVGAGAGVARPRNITIRRADGALAVLAQRTPAAVAVA